MWVKTLNLTSDDKYLVMSGDWLNDKIVDAVNSLVSKHLGNNTAQTTLLSQSAHGFKAVTQDSMQVLYDNNHWVASACVKGEIVIANSLGNVVSAFVMKQLKELYAPLLVGTGGLHYVTVVECAQQPNGNDCGVFAAAFVFEWTTLSIDANLSVKFNIPLMRAHLAQCLEKETVLPFPKVPTTRSCKPRVTHKVPVF